MLPATTRWLARGLSHRKLRLARMRPTESRSALFGIVAGIFVSGTGIGSLLPILPLYLRERGASYGLVGVIVGAALVAQAIGQWRRGSLPGAPAGRRRASTRAWWTPWRRARSSVHR